MELLLLLLLKDESQISVLNFFILMGKVWVEEDALL